MVYQRRRGDMEGRNAMDFEVLRGMER